MSKHNKNNRGGHRQPPPRPPKYLPRRHKMPLTDKAGRELKAGMIVDVPCYRMLTGVVKEVHETPIQTPQGLVPPRIVIELFPFFAVSQDGRTIQGAYVVDSGKTLEGKSPILDASGSPAEKPKEEAPGPNKIELVQ